MTEARRARRQALVLAALVVLAAGLRAWALWFGLPLSQARPDETTALGHAVQIAGGDLNPHFFNWPSLHLYVLAAVSVVTGEVLRLTGHADAARDFAWLVVPARAYVAVAGSLTVAVTYAMARQMTGRAAALAAALFLAVSPLHVRDSHFATTDVPMTLLVAVSLWLLLAGGRALDDAAMGANGRHVQSAAWRCALAGLAGGLATATKYNAALVVVAAAWVQVRSWRGVRVRRMAALAPFWLFAAGLVAGFLLGAPFSVLDFEAFRRDLFTETVHLSAGHSAQLGRGWLHHLTFSLPAGLGVPVFVAGLAGVILALRHPWRLPFVLASFAFAYYGFIGRGFTVFARYMMPLLPVLAVLGAWAIERAAGALSPRLRWRPHRAFAAAVILVALPSLVNSVWLVSLLGRTDSRALAGSWLTAHLPPDSTIFQSGREYVSIDVRSPRLHWWPFDPALGHFVGATPEMAPEWLVLHRSPVGSYTDVPPAIERLARTRYRLVKTFTATTDGGRPGDYDQQDAFFLPLRHFGAVVRPGTNIFVYRRREPDPAEASK